MSLPVVLVFAVGTGVELFLLTVIADYISIVNTLSEVMFSFLSGIFVGRSWGSEYFEKLQRHLKAREMPSAETLDGGLLAIASMLLITPGIVTDLLAVFLIIPALRSPFHDGAENMIKRKIAVGETYFFFKD